MAQLITNSLGRVKQVEPVDPAEKSYGGFDGGFGLLFGMAGMAGRNLDLTPTRTGAAAAYQLVPAVNRSVNLRADAVQSLKWELFTSKPGKDGKKTADDTVVDDSEQQTAQTSFGEAMREAQRVARVPLIWEMVFDHDLYGENYTEPLSNRYRVTGLKRLNPLGMIVNVSNGEVISYQWTPGGNSSKTIPFEPDELAYTHTLNPFDDFRGQGLLEVAMDTLNISRNLKRFLGAFFRNNAVPGGIISPKGEQNFSDMNRQIIKTEVNTYTKGSDNAYTMLVSPTPLELDIFEQPDIEKFYNINDPINTEIYTIFGVPLAMAGDSGRQRYKSGSDILDAFYMNTVIPLARFIQDYINFQILPYFQDMEGISFRFDLTEFDQASSDDKLRADIATQMFEATLWKRNQALVYVGTDPLPGDEGEAFYVPPAAPFPPQFGGGENAPPKLPDGKPKTPELEAGAKPVSDKTEKSIGESQSGFVCLWLANDPQLVAVQNQLKQIMTDPAIEWQNPATFHVTLVYADNVGDDALAGIAHDAGSTPVPIEARRMGLFDDHGNGQRAFYLRVEPNTPLAQLQGCLYQAFSDRHLSTSAFSLPSAYTPHITMAYLPTGVEPFMFSPDVHTAASEIHFGRDDYQAFERVPLTQKSHSRSKCMHCDAPPTKDVRWANGHGRAWFCDKHFEEWSTTGDGKGDIDIVHDIANGEVPADFSKSVRIIQPKQVSAEAVLRAWRNKALKGNALKSFVVPSDTLETHIEQFVRDGLEDIGATASKSLISAVFEDAAYAMGDYGVVKDYDDIAAAFQQQVGGLIDDSQADDPISQQAFGSRYRSALRTHGLQMFRQGMVDNGADPESLSAEQLKVFRDWQAANSQFVGNLRKAAYSENGLNNPNQRPDMWTNVSLRGIYYKGAATVAPDSLKVWLLGATEAHCGTCSGNNGQVKPLAEWDAVGFPGDFDKLDCHGVWCDCSLEDAPESDTQDTEKHFKGLETDEQRRWFFAHLGGASGGGLGSSGTSSTGVMSRTDVVREPDYTEPSADQHIHTLEGSFRPDTGTPGDTVESMNHFMRTSDGPLAYAMGDGYTGMLDVDYSGDENAYSVNSAKVKAEAAAFVKESQDIHYGKDYLLSLAKERAAENGVTLADSDLETAFNQQYATRAQAIQHLSRIGDVKLTEAQTRRLGQAADGNYLDMVYSREHSEGGSLVPMNVRRPTYTHAGTMVNTPAARAQARANFQDWVLGLAG